VVDVRLEVPIGMASFAGAPTFASSPSSGGKVQREGKGGSARHRCLAQRRAEVWADGRAVLQRALHADDDAVFVPDARNREAGIGLEMDARLDAESGTVVEADDGQGRVEPERGLFGAPAEQRGGVCGGGDTGWQ
jgi:hypothetical protein